MGITIETIKTGDGKSFPKHGDQVTLKYVGRLMDGTIFDDSNSRPNPFTCYLGYKTVIKGFEIAIPRLSVGQRARITIPPEYAYGSRGFPPVVPGNATLIFDIELLEIS